MPTTRPRHVITETEPIAQALAAAAERWPDDAGSRSRLLARLIEVGWLAIIDERLSSEASRRDAVARTSGALTGAYGKDHLTELREDWPD